MRGRAGASFAFRPRKLARPAQSLDVRQEVAGFLRGMVRGALEEPPKSGHDRIGHDRSRRVEMRKLPVRSADRAFTGQVGANPARAPEMRVIEARLPGERGRAESRNVGGQIPDLL